jgi:hypothetical protein
VSEASHLQDCHGRKCCRKSSKLLKQSKNKKNTKADIFQLLPLAITEAKHALILNRFNLIFDKLRQTKKSAKGVIQKNIGEILTNLLGPSGKDRKFPPKMNYLSKAYVFLINCSQILEKLEDGESQEDFQLFRTHLEEFLTHRNPTLQLNTYQLIFGSLWSGNFQLAEVLSEQGLEASTHSLRRSQFLLLLKIFYKNYRLLTLDFEVSRKCFQTVQENLGNYVGIAEQVSINEFHQLLQLLLAIRHFYQ